MLPVLPLLFLAATAAPAGFLGKALAPQSISRELLMLFIIAAVTSVVAVTPETISVLHEWKGSPNNLKLLVDLSIYQAQAIAAASVFAITGWAIGAGLQRLFED